MIACALVACGTSSPKAGGGDAGDDATIGDAGGDDALADGPIADAGIDARTRCGQVGGACNVVAQDCPPDQQCVVSNGTDKGACQPVTPSQVYPAGTPCCPSPNAGPCARGLFCFGPACDPDASPVARCAPACCDDGVCGTSSEGFAGHCDTQVADPNGAILFKICSYAQACKPFGIQPCPANEICLVTDDVGSAKCVAVYQPPGKGEGQPCKFANECADGLVCLTNLGCAMLCLTPMSNPPFDAGALDGGPGAGGCVMGKACTGMLNPQQFPPWLSFCQ